MINISEIKIGARVNYTPDNENGVVKSIPTFTNNSVFVVYHCDNNWDNFKNYTGQLTDIEDLTEGWVHD